MRIYETQLIQKGQVTIPAGIRVPLGIEPGDVVRFVATAEGVRMLSAQSPVDRHFGAAAVSGKTLWWREERAAFEEGVANDADVEA